MKKIMDKCVQCAMNAAGPKNESRLACESDKTKLPIANTLWMDERRMELLAPPPHINPRRTMVTSCFCMPIPASRAEILRTQDAPAFFAAAIARATHDAVRNAYLEA